MHARTQRAAGTRSFLDLLLLRRRSPADDLQALADGRSLVVSALRHGSRRWHQGVLTLDPTCEFQVVWTPAPLGLRASRGVPLAPPYAVLAVRPLEGTATGPDPLDFQHVELTAGGVDWDLAVPGVDVPLLRHALVRAGAR